MGFFNLKVVITDIGELPLLDATGVYAPIRVKSEATARSGKYKENKLGPYADHSDCLIKGRHVDSADGGLNCSLPLATANGGGGTDSLTEARRSVPGKGETDGAAYKRRRTTDVDEATKACDTALAQFQPGLTPPQLALADLTPQLLAP